MYNAHNCVEKLIRIRNLNSPEITIKSAMPASYLHLMDELAKRHVDSVTYYMVLAELTFFIVSLYKLKSN